VRNNQNALYKSLGFKLSKSLSSLYRSFLEFFQQLAQVFIQQLQLEKK
jgi:hypothetical protein